MNFLQIVTLLVVVFLIVSLYKEWFNPSLTFFICAIALVVTGVITPQELLKGLSNQQIIIIFLLILVTAGIRLIYGARLFAWLFSQKLAPKQLLIRMMVLTSSISAFLNNTPIVAFLIPYVKDWSERTGNASSKLLIPLSFATILGGMITVIGTSTNLVLNGLIMEYNLPMLKFTDFLYLGLLVTFLGWIYLYFIGYRLLPTNAEKLESVRANLKEYIVETNLYKGSSLIGKSVKEAGLRQLQDLFLVEILRDTNVISPVSPNEILEENDILFFSGNTDSIYRLINDDNGLTLRSSDMLDNSSQFNFVEAVIPSGSDLIGVKIKNSNFRNRFNASIVAMHRNGKRLSGKVGEINLSGGDFLLLLASEEITEKVDNNDLFIVSVPQQAKTDKPKWHRWIGMVLLCVLILGILNIIPLFTACLILLTALVFMKVLNLGEIKRNLDLGLLVVLVCSLAIGVALQKSQTADLIATFLISISQSMGPTAILTCLFIVTIFLTALISNAAAVSIMFPIAMAIAQQIDLPSTPFFIAIAFAASGDFMTPIGYQTNLMVYGPGGYTFKDFVRVGAPFTLLYITACVTFISWYYHF